MMFVNIITQCKQFVNQYISNNNEEIWKYNHGIVNVNSKTKL